MKIKLVNADLGDYIILEGENIDEIIEKGKNEMKKRYWNPDDCFSELISN